MQIRIRHLSRAAPETVQRATHAREPSLLAPKVRVQPLLEIYNAEVKFSRKMIFSRRYNLYSSRICENLITTLQTSTYIKIKTVRKTKRPRPQVAGLNKTLGETQG